jgi:hypothetical protein
MTDQTGSISQKALDRLTELQVERGEIVRMAKRGQLYEIRCEMPTCYCPKGREHFDEKSTPMKDWALNADHYPKLKVDGGTLTPGNIRLAHVLCNNLDYSWRLRIRKMLDEAASLKEIADDLNGKDVRPPHGSGSWTPATVRKAYVS